MSNLLIQQLARSLRGNGFPLSLQAFHARRLHLLHGGAGHRAAAVRERGHLFIYYKQLELKLDDSHCIASYANYSILGMPCPKGFKTFHDICISDYHHNRNVHNRNVSMVIYIVACSMGFKKNAFR